MRLIDADDFKKFMQALCKADAPYGCVVDLLDTQPTAYDVDKVVEELNKLDVKAITRYKGGTFGDYEGTDYYIKKSDAIEIVKQSGASDDVCEWKQTSTARYKTSCGYKLEAHFDTNACYCRQCGKKIKVVK